MIKNCQTCNTKFDGRRDAKTCSVRCRKRLQRAKTAILHEAGVLKQDAEQVINTLKGEIVPVNLQTVSAVAEEPLAEESLNPPDDSQGFEDSSWHPEYLDLASTANFASPPTFHPITGAVPVARTVPARPGLAEGVAVPTDEQLARTIQPQPQPVVQPEPTILSLENTSAPTTAAAAPIASPIAPTSAPATPSAPNISLPPIQPSTQPSIPEPHSPQPLDIKTRLRALLHNTSAVATLAALTMVMLVGGVFAASKLFHQSSSAPVASNQGDTTFQADENAKLTLNLDTILAKGKSLTLGQLIAEPTTNILQLTGDFTASGTLSASGGTTFANNSGLVIDKITVCTPAGCIPNVNIPTIAGSSGTAAGTAGAVAILNANQTFTASNKFSANSTSAFSIQNAAGTSNLLIADTISSRIGIGTATPAYTLDVNGDINSTTGIRLNGALLCNAGGCTAAGGSNSYIQNGTALQSANFNISSAATNSITAIIRALTAQTADLLQLKDQAGVNILTIGSTGNTLFQASTDSINAFSVQNAAGTSHLIGGDTLNARVAIAKPTPPDYTLDVGGDINSTTGLRVAGNLVCSTVCTPGGGSGNYIQNGINLQTANFAIQSDLNTHIGALIRGASGQSADLLRLVNGDSGVSVATFGASGSVLLKNATDSTTAFQVQNAAGNSVLAIDTTNIRAVFGTNNPSKVGVIAIDSNAGFLQLQGSANLDGSGGGGVFLMGGTNITIQNGRPIAGDVQLQLGVATSAYVFKDYNTGANLFNLNNTGQAIFKNSADSTTAFQVQNLAGTNLLVVDSSAQKVAIGPLAVPANSALTIGTSTTTAAGGLTFGADALANLYRSAAGVLSSDATNIKLQSGDNRIYFGSGGSHIQGDGSNATFAWGGALYLQNTAENVTYGKWSNVGLALGGNVVPTSQLMLVSDAGTAASGIAFGSAGDINLYRPNAGELRTNVSGFSLSGANAAIYFAGTNGTFQTDNQTAANSQTLRSKVSGDAQARFILQADGTLNWGSGALVTDTNLYRSAADTLKTDDALQVGTRAGIGLAPDSDYGLMVQQTDNGYLRGAIGLKSSTGAPRLGFYDTNAADVSSRSWSIAANSTNLGELDFNVQPVANQDPLNVGQGHLTVLALKGNGAAIFKNAVDSTTAFQIQNAAGTSVVLDVDTTNKRVGIGLNNPSQPLHVVGQGVGLGAIRMDNTGGGATLVVNRTDGKSAALQANTTGGVFAYNDSGDFRIVPRPAAEILTGTFTSTNNSIFLVDSSGVITMGYNGRSYLNIGQTGASTFKNFSDSAAAFQVQNAAGTSNLLVADTTNTRIGIGVAVPAATLDVAGILNAQATNAVGAGSLQATITKDDANSRTFNTGLIRTTFSTGASNTTTVSRGLVIDSSNTISTGVTSYTPLVIDYPTGTTIYSVANTGAVAQVAATASAVAYNLSANSLNSGTGLGISSTATALSSGKLLSISKTGTSGSTAYTGDIANIAYSQTFNGGVGLDSTGNTLDISRNITLNNAGNTHTISGALATLSDSATQTAGTLTHTADVLDIAQNYTANTGAALNVTTAGTGLALRVNDDGTLTDTTAFVVDAGGKVGIGMTAPSSLLQLGSDAGTAASGISLGSTGDTNLYRSAAGSLKTDGELRVAGSNGLILGASGTAFLTSPSDGVFRMFNGGATAGIFAIGNTVGLPTGVTFGFGIQDGATPTSTPTNGGFLYASAGALCWKGSAGTNTCFANADYAEDMPVTSDVQASDIVSLSNQLNPNQTDSVSPFLLEKSQKTYDSQIIGVVSSLAGAPRSNGYQPIALAGRVPVHVTNENGAIVPGDYLTSSSTPGYAMKATQAGMVVGKALASFNDASGTVLVLVGTQYYNPQPNLQGGNPTVDSLIVHNELSVGTLTVSGNATFMGSLTVAGNTTVQGTLTLADHVITTGPAVTITGVVGSGTDAQGNPSATVTSDGNDQAGTITITTSTNPTVGELSKVTFSRPYSKAPKVTLTPANANAADLKYFYNSTINDFTLCTNSAPAAATTYTFSYFVIQ